MCGVHVATGSAARPAVYLCQKNVKGKLKGNPAAAPASISSLQTAASTRSGRIRAGTTCFSHQQGKSLFYWRWSGCKSCPVCFTLSFNLWTVEPFWLLASVRKVKPKMSQANLQHYVIISRYYLLLAFNLD